MTAKEQFLQNIKNRIKVLQDAYDYNKNLPDDVFESLFGNINVNGNGQQQAERVAITIDGQQQVLEYGANKKLIRDIIANAANGIMKQTIIDKVLVARPSETKEDVSYIVTNALAAMAKDKEVAKFKPSGFRGKGYYWKMAK
jgi:hypothetical protein